MVTITRHDDGERRWIEINGEGSVQVSVRPFGYYKANIGRCAHIGVSAYDALSGLENLGEREPRT